MKVIKEILKIQTWSLREFAWICAGFSPFDHPMNLTRLVDGQEVIHGSIDYITAKSEYDKYLGIVFGDLPHGPPVSHDTLFGLPFFRGAQRYHIDDLLMHYHLYERGDSRISLPWIAWAVENELLPAKVFGESGSKATDEIGANFIRKKFNVKKVTTEMPDFKLWVINQLQEYSEKGKNRPTMLEMVKLMQQKKNSGLVKVHGSEIIFLTAHAGHNVTWAKEALKQFIYSNTSLETGAK